MRRSSSSSSIHSFGGSAMSAAVYSPIRTSGVCRSNCVVAEAGFCPPPLKSAGS
jgi:hypothetical protein